MIEEYNKKTAELIKLKNLAILKRDDLNHEIGFDFLHEAVDFIALTSGQNNKKTYSQICAHAKSIVINIKKKIGDSKTRLFLQLLIIQAMISTIERRIDTQLPETLSANQIQNFYRILSGRDVSDSWLNVDKDLFMKEYGIASERLFAAGPQLLDKNCGIPRSIIFKEGFYKGLKNLRFFISLRGFKPLIQIHVHKFNLEKFNESGRNECYKGCLELCIIHPEILGIFGSSWFYDPVIFKISPRLGYLQSIPMSGGANLLYYSTGGLTVENALSTSNTRKKLYEEGKYAPKNYMMIWSRKCLEKWAKGVDSNKI